MKKNRIAKLLALLLCLSLFTGLLAGCGSDSSDTEEEETTEAEETVEEEEEEEEAAEEETAEEEAAEETAEETAEEETAEEPAEEETAEEEADEESAAEAFTGAISAEKSTVVYPVEEEGITLTYWHPFTSTMPGVYDYITDIPALEAISENTGITIEWTTVSGMEMFTSFNLMAAAGDYCDIIQSAVECYSGGAVGALDDGVIVDLTDYMEENAPEYLSFYESTGTILDVTTSDGRYAAIYGAYNYENNGQGYVIRQDWLDELGLDIPVTYDDYYEVLVAFKDAYGCTEAFMMDETCQDEYHTSAGYGTPGYKTGDFGTGTDLYQVDGVVTSSFLQEGYREYLAEMNKWYEAGLFTSDFISLSSQPNSDDRSQLISNGNSGIWYVGATSIDSQSELAEGMVITGIADPVTEEGDINHFSSATIVNTQCDASISSDCENIEAALQYLNYYFTAEGIMLYNYGVEGETYNLVDGAVEYTDLILNPAYDYPSFTMTEAYVLVGMVASVTDNDRALSFYSDATTAALETWNSTQDTDYVLPAGLSLTTEESEEASALQSDISTYVSECIPKFILGEMSVEDDWDEFQQNCISMGLEDVIAIYQDALDRYYAA